MFKDGPSEHKGKYFNFPLRMVVPKPMQKPHLPLWVACSQLETLAKCGEWGMGALGFQFVSADAAHAWVHAYYNAFVKRQKLLADYKTNPNIALVSPSSPAAARAWGASSPASWWPRAAMSPCATSRRRRWPRPSGCAR